MATANRSPEVDFIYGRFMDETAKYREAKAERVHTRPAASLTPEDR